MILPINAFSWGSGISGVEYPPSYFADRRDQEVQGYIEYSSNPIHLNNFIGLGCTHATDLRCLLIQARVKL